MALMVRYRLGDGGIEGVWEATPVTMLDAQIQLEETDYGYVFVETGLLAVDVLQHHYVWQGELQRKTVLTLTAQAATFPADGASLCQVTVTPFVPCQVRVDGDVYPLTPEDPSVVLLADVPHRFLVSLEPLAAYEAAALTVEAT